jgi:phage tail sheath protein FI
MTGSGIADQTSDANVLNAAGIVTVFKVGGSRRLWGNRSAAWPTDTDVRSFIPLQRVEDIVDESIENGMLPFLDKPLVQATIDAIKETANQFISTLIQRGALLVGSEVYYDPADNTAPELALGHVVFRKVFMAGTPAERITFMSSIQINLLTNLS